MMKWVFLDGKFIEEEKALIHFRDLSFQRGYGIFDFFRLVDNKPLFLDDHLDRFFASAEGMYLPVSLQREELKEIIQDLVKKNDLPHTGVRLSLTGGYSDDSYTIGKPVLVISQHTFTQPTEEQVKKGVRLVSYPYQRQLPHIKTIDYLMAVWLHPLRAQKGADEVLYHNHGLITECPRNNFFLVTNDDKIITTSEGVLAGITRKKVLELAGKEFTVEERPLTLEEVQSAKEAFITSTTKLLLPVNQVDDIVLPNRQVSTHLLTHFRQICNP
jgi:branched-chain amino acid aminotransferase